MQLKCKQSISHKLIWSYSIFYTHSLCIILRWKITHFQQRIATVFFLLSKSLQQIHLKHQKWICRGKFIPKNKSQADIHLSIVHVALSCFLFASLNFFFQVFITVSIKRHWDEARCCGEDHEERMKQNISHSSNYCAHSLVWNKQDCFVCIHTEQTATTHSLQDWQH